MALANYAIICANNTILNVIVVDTAKNNADLFAAITARGHTYADVSTLAAGAWLGSVRPNAVSAFGASPPGARATAGF